MTSNMATESEVRDTTTVARDGSVTSNEPNVIEHNSAITSDVAYSKLDSTTNQLPQTDRNQSTGLVQAEPHEANANSHSRSPQNLVLEIRALQNRLLLLEEQATSELDINCGGSGQEGDSETVDDPKDEREVQKHIRRAHESKKWVEKSEERAEKTTHERGRLGMHVRFMDNITDNDTAKISRDKENFRRYDEYSTRTNVNLRPIHGIRPPTSLRPIYSRKLGPPTQWDTSDSEEWNSDDSTHSRDFDYFRARLRGDFEWEIDRLTAQKRRYDAHKEKKRAKELAKSTDEERERQQTTGNHQDGEQDSNTLGDGEDHTSRPSEPAEESALPGLQFLEWDMFKSARKAPTPSCFSIYILIGEPKLHNYAFGNLLGNRLRATVGAKSRSGAIATARSNMSQPGAPAKQAMAHPPNPDGQAPLPERIRIHSKQLIKTLSVIHRSDLIPGEDPNITSIVMLRSFRMLTYYKDEIRDWYTKLSDKLQPTKLTEEMIGPENKPGTETEEVKHGKSPSPKLWPFLMKYPQTRSKRIHYSNTTKIPRLRIRKATAGLRPP